TFPRPCLSRSDRRGSTGRIDSSSTIATIFPSVSTPSAGRSGEQLERFGAYNCPRRDTINDRRLLRGNRLWPRNVRLGTRSNVSGSDLRIGRNTWRHRVALGWTKWRAWLHPCECLLRPARCAVLTNRSYVVRQFGPRHHSWSWTVQLGYLVDQ